MLKEYVYGLYDNMYHDGQIGPMLKSWMQTAPHDFYMQHLKDRTVDYLECVWALDQWDGQDLFVAHAHLHLTPEIFDRCMKCGNAKLKKMNLSSGIKKEILEQMDVMKEPITDPEGKFDKWIRDKNAKMEAASAKEGAVDLSGMGFAVSPERVKAMADKAQKDKDRSERLKAARKEREMGKTSEKVTKDKATKAVETAKGDGATSGQPKATPKATPKAKGGKEHKATSAQSKDESGRSKAKANAKSKVDAQVDVSASPRCPAEEPPILPPDGIIGFVPDSRTTHELLMTNVVRPEVLVA